VSFFFFLFPFHLLLLRAGLAADRPTDAHTHTRAFASFPITPDTPETLTPGLFKEKYNQQFVLS